MDLQGIGLGSTATLIVIILVSLSVHEFAHAYVANLFGDPTAKLEGRLTLNPIAHWDPIGTTLLVGLLLLSGLGLSFPVIFGWGKPVPVNEGNFENPRFHGFQTAIAGPMSNFVLALLIALLVRFAQLPEVLQSILVTAIFLNLFLMFFNLLPIPPLDGSRILRLFISERAYFALAANPLILIVLLILVISFLGQYLVLATASLTRLLLGF